MAKTFEMDFLFSVLVHLYMPDHELFLPEVDDAFSPIAEEVRLKVNTQFQHENYENQKVTEVMHDMLQNTAQFKII